MSDAFEQACIALNIPPGDVRGREVIAMRIIDLARRGVTDRRRCAIACCSRRGQRRGDNFPENNLSPLEKTARYSYAPCSPRGVNR